MRLGRGGFRPAGSLWRPRDLKPVGFDGAISQWISKAEQAKFVCGSR